MERISEADGREYIAKGWAGYWALSLRDSISKSPIVHPDFIVAEVDSEWYLLTTKELKIVDLGYVQIGEGTGVNKGRPLMGHLCIPQLDSEHPLYALLQAEAKKKGRNLNGDPAILPDPEELRRKS